MQGLELKTTLAVRLPIFLAERLYQVSERSKLNRSQIVEIALKRLLRPVQASVEPSDGEKEHEPRTR